MAEQRSVKNNPYSLIFGREPREVIPRLMQADEMIQGFTGDPPSQQICMLTGVRGCGKTVQMTLICKHFMTQEDWVVLELNPEGDILQSLASRLASQNTLAKIFQGAKINLSFFGIGLEVKDSVPVTDIEMALSQMLASLKKRGKKVLIALDEVTNTPQMRQFAAAFQIFLRQDLPLFLIMTGLYENIYELQNEKSLTFLYRAPKVQLQPLNIGTMMENYQKVLQIDQDKALRMAQMTRGYSFAFQVLGYFSWLYPKDDERVFTAYKQHLQEYVYEKMWMELSEKDRKILWAMAKEKEGKVSAIKEMLNLKNNEFTPYRERLIRKGIIESNGRGYVRFVLPLFEEFVMERTFLEE
ncbi:MAG: ATP-binding protein [Clostridia bacterium]|nr:ATP-binding protein [Clostridia bacterium]